MKKKYLLGLFALSAIILVGCKDKQTDVDTDLDIAIQLERETLTQATSYWFENSFYELPDSVNIYSLVLTSKNVQIEYGERYFSNYAGTGYAFNLALYSNDFPLGAGTYTIGEAGEMVPGTFDPKDTYLNILHGNNATKVIFQSGSINVDVKGQEYCIAINVVSTAGATITATYSGALVNQFPYAFREPATTDSFSLKADTVLYEPGETNYSDWALDSVYSYYALYYGEGAIYYAEVAESYYQEGDSATGDEYMGYAEEMDYYANYYAGEKDDNTPLNAHMFTMTTEEGDVLNLEIDLERLDAEYTDIIPNGAYVAGYGYGIAETPAELWGNQWKIVGSYLTTANGDIYYLYEAMAEVKMNGYEVQSLKVTGTTTNGSKLTFSYQ